MLDRIHKNDAYANVSRKGAINDPDMMEVRWRTLCGCQWLPSPWLCLDVHAVQEQVGNPPLTDAENRAHFSLWCLAKAPLLMGTDLTNIT